MAQGRIHSRQGCECRPRARLHSRLNYFENPNSASNLNLLKEENYYFQSPINCPLVNTPGLVNKNWTSLSEVVFFYYSAGARRPGEKED